MPNRFRKREQVDRDLDSLWSFIAADSPGAANRQIDRIGEVFEMLTQHPLAGRLRSDLGQNLRSFPVGNYIIFHIPLSDGIEVVRVMHGRQDIDADDMARPSDRIGLPRCGPHHQVVAVDHFRPPADAQNRHHVR